jgi:hypothetical protein
LLDKELPTDGLWDGLKEVSLINKEDITVVLETTIVSEELLLKPTSDYVVNLEFNSLVSTVK